MANYKPWSEDEEFFIIRNCQKMTIKEMAKHLERSELSVMGKAYYMRKQGKPASIIKSGEDHHNSVYSNADVEMCRRLKEESDLSITEIARKMEMPRSTVGKICDFYDRNIEGVRL